MSTQINTYVIYGVKLPFPSNDDYDQMEDKIEPYIDSAFEGIHHHNGLCVLDDGMNGEYVFIGKVMAKTEDCQHFYEPICVDMSLVEREDIVQLITKHFGIANPDVKPWVVSHYR